MFRKLMISIWYCAGMLAVLSGCASSTIPDQLEPNHELESIEPTEEPTPTIEYDAPSFFSVPDQIILPQEEFLLIDLTEFVYRVDPASNVITWKAENDPELNVTFDGPMMRVEKSSADWNIITSILVEACNPGNKCGSTEIDITVIGNIENGIFHTQVDGIIIESGGTKIMIDALFSNPWGTNYPQILQAMREAAPPYDQADLILITHHHADHFDAELTVQNMLQNPRAVLLSTDIVVDLLSSEEGFDQISDRVTGFKAAPGMHEVVSAAGLEIEVIYLSHGKLEEMPNFGYLFKLDNKIYFHTGDVVLDDEPLSTFIDYGIPEMGIDYAFVPYFMLTRSNYFSYATEGIVPEFLVPVHIPTQDKQRGFLFETIEEEFNNLLLFRDDFDWFSFDHQ